MSDASEKHQPTPTPSALIVQQPDVSYQESDDLIWERFKSGNENALTFIYRTYSNILFNYGCQFVNDHDLVRDALQDMFIDLINSRERLGATTSIKFYLMKCFRNKILKALKNSKQRREAEDGSSKESFLVTISAEARWINGQLDQQKERLIEESLNQLPPLQREALILYFFEGLKYEQIADMLGIKVKSSRALIYRSTESLGKILGPHKTEILSMLTLLHLLNN